MSFRVSREIAIRKSLDCSKKILTFFKRWPYIFIIFQPYYGQAN